MALDVDAIRQRRWWRHTVHGAHPLVRRLPAPDHRWQRGAIVEAHLAETGIPPNQQVPRDLWTWAVDPGLEVADLRSTECLKRVGLAVPRPRRRPWRPYQEIGETLWHEGWPGLLAPSAARPQDGLVLCLFRGAERIVGARPVSPPRVVRDPPAPPAGMVT